MRRTSRGWVAASALGKGADVGLASPPHVVLIGLPGSGKTSVGRLLAGRLSRQFLDFDEEIERREGQSVGRIFAERGEAYFRELERRLTEELRAVGGGMVLAPGGGWITVPRVVELLRPPAALVYLSVRPESALARMGQARERRPLLAKPDPLMELKRLFAERQARYEEVADFVTDTEVLEMNGVTDQIAAWLSLFERNSVMPGGK
jgi:shikimate kinase